MHLGNCYRMSQKTYKCFHSGFIATRMYHSMTVLSFARFRCHFTRQRIAQIIRPKLTAEISLPSTQTGVTVDERVAVTVVRRRFGMTEVARDIFARFSSSSCTPVAAAAEDRERQRERERSRRPGREESRRNETNPKRAQPRNESTGRRAATNERSATTLCTKPLLLLLLLLPLTELPSSICRVMNRGTTAIGQITCDSLG